MNYEGGIYKIKKLIKENYSPVKSNHNTGILRIFFKVSDKGILKDIQNEQYSLEYQKTTIDKNIVIQLTQIVRKIEKWTSVPCSLSPCYSFKFFTFKIIDGEITEILPK